MKMKKKFNQHKKWLINYYNFQIRQYGSIQKVLNREQKEQKLKLRHLKFQRRQEIAKNDNGKVLWFPIIEQCYLWQRKNGRLQKLPKTTAEDKLIAFSYLHVPPLSR